jgi:cytoskeleton protein RodZ
MEMMDGAGTTETTRAGGGLAEIGTMLRRRREEVGQSLETVSAATHIRAHYLKAIEEGRRRELPGTAYMIGYVRTYADYLGLDGDRLITDYHAELAGPRKKAEKKPEPEPVGLPQIQLSPITLVVALLAFGLAGYLAYGYFSEDEAPVETASVETPPAAPVEPETTAAPPPPPQPSPSPAPTDAEASSSGMPQEVPQSATPDPSTGETATEDQVPPEADIAALPEDLNEESPPQAEPPQAEAAEGETAAGAEANKIVLRAKLESWIQVTNAKKEVVFSRVLRAGETYTVPEEEGLTLTTGNAGGVEITVGNTKLKSLGTVGLVKRDIPLDPQKLRDGSAFKTERVTSGSQ